MAAVGALVCPGCEERVRGALRDLPSLWADLAERPRLSGVSRFGGSSESSVPLGHGAVEARHRLVIVARVWLSWVCSERDVRPPLGSDVSAGTLRIRAYHDACAAHLTAKLHKADPRDRERIAEQIRDHQQEAARCQQDYDTGRDQLIAMTDVVSRHLGWALNTDAAGDMVAELVGAVVDARRIANPSMPGLSVLCECGARVPVHTTDIMTCPGCGLWGVVQWWVAREAPAVAPMRLSDLPDWLLTRGIGVSVARLRSWAKTRRIVPSVVGGSGKANLYDPIAVAQVATSTKTRAPRKTKTEPGTISA